MASKLAATLSPQAPASKGLFGGKASQFYLEVCRCLPFIYRIHQVEEVVTLPELRRIIKDKFLLYKDVKDPRVIDMLIFKGREELETYLMRHKQRHHMITEYAEPYQQGKTAVKKLTGQSQFLDNFFSTPYPQTPQKL